MAVLVAAFLMSACSVKKWLRPGGEWEGYSYSYYCPAYCFSEKGWKAERLDVMHENHISMAGPGFAAAYGVARRAIVRRGGEAFDKRVTLYDVDITYPDSVRCFANKHPRYDLEKCGATAYFFRFLFTLENGGRCRFGIALNARLEVISPLFFPDGAGNPGFTKTISPYRAYKIAEKKYRRLIIPMDYIELNYDSLTNRFVWEIMQQTQEGSKAYYVSNGYVRIDAATGKLADSGTLSSMLLITPRF